MRRLCIIVWLMALAIRLFAAGPEGNRPVEKYWTCDPHQYANNMTMIGVVSLNGTELLSESFEIGAFCGEECRGSELL